MRRAADRLPAGPGRRVWVAAIALLLCGLGGLELCWRVQGFTPSVTDGEDLWARHRARVERAGPKTLLLLGRSRIQEQFVPEVFLESCPGMDYIQLAVGGKHPIATLFDVADNTAFSGTVLCSVTAPSLLPALWDQQAEYLHHYHTQWNPLGPTACWTKTALQSKLALLAPELLIQRSLPDLLQGRLDKQFLWTRADRSQHVDYHRVDIDAFRQIQLGKIEKNLERYRKLPDYTAWPAGLERIEKAVARIQARGGHIVFLRCPTTGSYRERERLAFPRERFWDHFAAQTAAQTWHFEDIPELAAMECAEGTHLYPDDARRFTACLARLLKAQGLATHKGT